MIKAVIFDYGGVVAGKVTDFYIIDEKGEKISGDPSLKPVAQILGLSYSDFFSEIGSYIPEWQRGEIEEKVLWERIAAKYRLQLPSEYRSLSGEGFLEIYPENQEVVEIISSLRKQGTLVGLLSNTIEAHAAVNEREGRFTKFDFTILSHQVGFRKPEEGIYQKALEKTKLRGIHPPECVYIDDIPDYLEPARQLGLQTINFRNGEHKIDALKQNLSYLGLNL